MQGKTAEPHAARPGRHGLRRVAVLVVVHLAMGVVLTLVVAYGLCAVGASGWFTRLAGTTPVPMARGPVLKADGKVWDGLQWSWGDQTSHGVRRCFAQLTAPLGNVTIEPEGESVAVPPSWAICRDPSVAPAAVHNPRGQFWFDSAFGWPWLCLHQRMENSSTSRNRRGYTAHTDSLQVTIPFLKSRFNHDGQWPTHVLWPGMLGNVCAWALIAAVPWGVVALSRRARLRRRVKAGRCAACNYDRSTLPKSAACPECGAKP